MQQIELHIITACAVILAIGPAVKWAHRTVGGRLFMNWINKKRGK